MSFGLCVLTGVQESVTRSGQRAFAVGGGRCIDANREAGRYCRDGDCERGWMWTIHGACNLLSASYRTICESRQQRAVIDHPAAERPLLA
jgi:hypothetical protein